MVNKVFWGIIVVFVGISIGKYFLHRLQEQAARRREEREKNKKW